MWYIMSRTQENHNLSERLIRSISNWETFTGGNDDVEYLLELGADVNCTHGMLMPLHCACMVCEIETAKLLIARGANVNAVDGYGRAAIHYAAEKDTQCIDILAENAANLDIPDGNQARALHWASFKNNVECVKRLLSYGADVNSQDFNRDSPLSWAAHKTNLETIRILLDYNADVSLTNFNGQTALLRCALMQATGLNSPNRDEACIDLLVRASGNLNLRDAKGQLPAIIYSDNRLREILLPQCMEPRALQDICRCAVRKLLGPNYLPHTVYRLPIPTRLKDFLLLRI
ncbi:ankyrin repeat and SOCS box protein 8-like [Tubulanus polymorphus]|uniref:ankyrin repeat and SOCS box protein 8-like n=1 Tax=Tubulanus polymorphus TaxID=672921 RepID=UPI003DA273B2